MIGAHLISDLGWISALLIAAFKKNEISGSVSDDWSPFQSKQAEIHFFHYENTFIILWG